MNKIFKRILTLMLVAVMLLSSCAVEDPSDVTDIGNSSENSSETEKPTEKPTEDVEEGGLTEALPKPKYFTVKYTNTENGRIDGELEQQVERGTSSKVVRAIADEGYVFAGWSDGYTIPTRIEEDVRGDISVSPKFVSSDYEFSVTYEVVKNGTRVESITLKAKATDVVKFTPTTPPLAYTHSDWSDGNEEPERTDTLFSDGKVFTIELVPATFEVPVLEIYTETGRGIESKVEYQNCSVSLSNTDAEDCFEDVKAQIRGRGNSSWTYPKKGFKLKFENKRSMLGSDYKVKNWVFISNYGDKSLIRNMIAYDMSDAFTGLKFTTMHEFIDVYLNGEYYGLFLLCDRIDENEGRLDIETGVLEDPSQMGYIIEIGMTDPKGIGIDGIKMSRDKGRGYYISYPDVEDPLFDPDVHLKYIGDYLDQCLKALSDQDWERICELIDIDSFVDYYILQELFMNKDCFWRSVHFYKEPGGKLYAGPAWDFDQGLGNVSDLFGLGAYDTTPDIDINFVDNQYSSGKTAGSLWIAAANTWFRRLLRNSEFKELVAEHLFKYRPVIEDILERTVTDGSNPNSYYSLYGKAMERNFERWKIMGVSVWPNTPLLVKTTTVTGQIDYVHDWIAERYRILCEWYA